MFFNMLFTLVVNMVQYVRVQICPLGGAVRWTSPLAPTQLFINPGVTQAGRPNPACSTLLLWQ